ncbi:hypothetical protein STEG23_008127, partial [Scotinomys teguina]
MAGVGKSRYNIRMHSQHEIWSPLKTLLAGATGALCGAQTWEGFGKHHTQASWLTVDHHGMLLVMSEGPEKRSQWDCLHARQIQGETFCANA